MKGENSFTAWDGQRYAGQPPTGWYLAADNRWWPNEEARRVGGPEADDPHRVLATLPPPPIPNQPSSRVPRSGERRLGVDQLDLNDAEVYALWPNSANRSTSLRFLVGMVLGLSLLIFVAFPLAVAILEVPAQSGPERPDEALPPVSIVPATTMVTNVLEGPARPVREPGGGSVELVNCGWTEPRTGLLIVSNAGAEATAFVVTIVFEEIETLAGGTAAVVLNEITVATSAIEPGTAQEVRPFIDGEPRLNICRVTSIRPVN